MTTDPILPAHPSGAWPTLLPGWVWLVGAGPGDPGLLTLNGLNGLRQADVIVHDALIDPAVLTWAAPGARLVSAGKRGGVPSPKQREISADLIDLARAGARVIRLKGGDPFMFGRGGEEAEDILRAGVPFRVVPGISAGIGGLAYAGIPVTHRDVNQAVTFLTGHDHAGAAPTALDWGAIAQGAQVLVIYMGMRRLGEIADKLIAGGRPPDDPVAIVANAAQPAQQVVETTLAEAARDAAAAGVGAPAIICVGRAALMRRALDWMRLVEGRAPRSLTPLD